MGKIEVNRKQKIRPCLKKCKWAELASEDEISHDHVDYFSCKIEIETQTSDKSLLKT